MTMETYRLELTEEQCWTLERVLIRDDKTLARGIDEWGAVAAAGLVAEQAAVRDLRRTLSRAIIGP
jgi:hypothetical protein